MSGVTIYTMAYRALMIKRLLLLQVPTFWVDATQTAVDSRVLGKKLLPCFLTNISRP